MLFGVLPPKNFHSLSATYKFHIWSSVEVNMRRYKRLFQNAATVTM